MIQKLALGMFLLTSSTTVFAVTQIPTGSEWRYLDDGSNQGTAWRARNFNDSAWLRGSAELGYGDGDESTVIGFGPDANNKFITTYFRHSFTIQDASEITGLTANLLRDDGAVVYLNGTEVIRSNMPGGSIGFRTLASRGIGGSAERQIQSADINANLLRNGRNVIAVEVHQNGGGSSDLSFDLELISEEAAPPPPQSTTDTLVSTGSQWRYLDDGSNQGTAWRARNFNDSAWLRGSAELGYGDGDESTVIGFGPDARNKFITTYFRRSFTLQDASSITSLTANLLRDDGAVVYLNGTEVIRSNMPGGNIGFRTLASRGIGGSAERQIQSADINTNLLRDGRNVIAVEVHQNGGASSDLSFDFELISESGSGGGQADPNLPLVDNFNGGLSLDWRTRDDAGNRSDWRPVNNTYQQRNQVRASRRNLVESYHLGSYSYINDSFDLSDYRFSVDIIPTGENGDNIGVMFRYRDNDNYYRLSMDARFGFTRLEKRVNGEFTTLARNAIGYRVNRQQRVVIEVVGSSIFVTINGDSLFAVEDSDIASGTVALYASTIATFDNVVVEAPSNDASVVLATPGADSVVTANAFSVEALVNNAPVGSQVDFVLDGNLVSSITNPPYIADFSGISRGNHTVSVELFDSRSTRLDSDSNDNIGVVGNNALALGDSITNGTGDRFASDNRSANGRVVGNRGYASRLSDLLTIDRSAPQIVFNEGIGGDGAFEAISRVESILERHPQSNEAFLMLGTNDANGSLPVPAGVYRDRMESVIDELPNSITTTVAVPPPIFGRSSPFSNPLSASPNNFIRDYRRVIQNDLSGINIGPDFFNCFLEEENYFSLFEDNLHPNGLGHSAMSQIWRASLSGRLAPRGRCVLSRFRFVLLNLEPSTSAPYIKQNLIEAGDPVYVDEDYTLASSPRQLRLDRGLWIMPANADRNNSRSSYITFDVDRNVTTYIAYNINPSNASHRIPNWMSGYTDTGLSLTVDGVSRPYRLYSRNFSSGDSITLGGNMASGASGANNQYLAIVVRN